MSLPHLCMLPRARPGGDSLAANHRVKSPLSTGLPVQ